MDIYISKVPFALAKFKDYRSNKALDSLTILILMPRIGTDFFFLESEKWSIEPHSAHLFKRDFGRSTLQMDI